LSKKKGVTSRPKEGLVIDSSVAIAWCFPDEQDEYSQSVLSALASSWAVVPDLWHLEVANTLLVGERRKRSTQANTVTWLGFLVSLPIAVDEETRLHAFGPTLSLAASTTFPLTTPPISNWPYGEVCRWPHLTTN